jgi:hypothetical protein
MSSDRIRLLERWYTFYNGPTALTYIRHEVNSYFYRVLVFWDRTPCRWVSYCLKFRRSVVPSKHHIPLSYQLSHPRRLWAPQILSHIFTPQPKLRGSWWPFGLRRWDLRPLDCWDCGFESRRGHGCSFLVFVVSCIRSGLCDELITRSKESYRVCVCVSNCVI